mmetsp:Transcript_126348/g.352085  ORF Transcript_126348/g.352085 Transcript_126348/m.352085 type:complete len:213 (+) Transcript_126348:706-1344(+)
MTNEGRNLLNRRSRVAAAAIVGLGHEQPEERPPRLSARLHEEIQLQRGLAARAPAVQADLACQRPRRGLGPPGRSVILLGIGFRGGRGGLLDGVLPQALAVLLPPLPVRVSGPRWLAQERVQRRTHRRLPQEILQPQVRGTIREAEPRLLDPAVAVPLQLPGDVKDRLREGLEGGELAGRTGGRDPRGGRDTLLLRLLPLLLDPFCELALHE